jgi:hypothetical protein
MFRVYVSWEWLVWTVWILDFLYLLQGIRYKSGWEIFEVSACICMFLKLLTAKLFFLDANHLDRIIFSFNEKFEILLITYSSSIFSLKIGFSKLIHSFNLFSIDVVFCIIDSNDSFCSDFQFFPESFKRSLEEYVIVLFESENIEIAALRHFEKSYKYIFTWLYLSNLIPQLFSHTRKFVQLFNKIYMKDLHSRQFQNHYLQRYQSETGTKSLDHLFKRWRLYCTKSD